MRWKAQRMRRYKANNITAKDRGMDSHMIIVIDQEVIVNNLMEREIKY